jgi:hypothetical protein
MPRLHLNEDRPDHLPIAAAVWDETKGYTSATSETAVALYQAIKKLETEVIALRDR